MLNESNVNEKIQKMERKADNYFKKYRGNMNLLEKSLLSKIRPIDSYDVYCLGSMLESFDTYRSICEEDGTTNLLGKLPLIAHDVITVVYGTSVMPVIASVQPVEEEQGLVYFRNVKAGLTRGNMTEGETMAGPYVPGKTPSGYASSYVETEDITTTAAQTYNVTLARFPIRREGYSITSTIDGVFGRDDGNGFILGVGISGTINYDTGEVVLNLAAAPNAGETIHQTYHTDFENSTDIPLITHFWDSKLIKAKVFALKGTVGMLQSFALRKRFGLVAEDELARDLIGEINSEIGGDLIRKMVVGAMGNTNWDKTAPASTSYYEHQMTIKNAIADADGVLAANAGRGTISVLIAGTKACAVLSTLPGFTKLADGVVQGPHVFGTLDGVTVIRVLEAALLDPATIIGIWKGTSPFEAPAAYTPYMPLTVTATLPMANPLVSQKAAAVWAGTDILVNNYITKITVQNA